MFTKTTVLLVSRNFRSRCLKQSSQTTNRHSHTLCQTTEQTQGLWETFLVIHAKSRPVAATNRPATMYIKTWPGPWPNKDAPCETLHNRDVRKTWCHRWQLIHAQSRPVAATINLQVCTSKHDQARGRIKMRHAKIYISRIYTKPDVVGGNW